MKNILTVIKREYIQRVRSRWFLIGTFLTPLFILAIAFVPALVMKKGGGLHDVVVLNQSGDPGLYNAITKRVTEPIMDSRFSLTEIVIPQDKNIEDEWEKYRPGVEKGSDTAYLIITPGIFTGESALYRARNVSDFAIDGFGRSVSTAIVERRLVKEGLDPNKVGEFTKSIDVVKRKVGPSGETREFGQSYIVGFILLFVIYFSVLLYGAFVLRGVIEEKQTRVVEVILSSVRPFELMMGKLVGIGLVGLTQFGVWTVSGAVIMYIAGKLLSGQGTVIPQIPVGTLICFIVYFILGFFLFGTLYAMAGSMVSSEDDAQQVAMPIMMLIILPMLLFMMIVRDPSGTASVILSMIPFFAPTLMMMRIAILTPPLWQILLSMLIMVVTILGAVWVAARIYRVGILMYGKRPSLAEIGRWLRYS